MFCAQCGAEYREGFSICSDCQIPLVEKLPEKSGTEAEADMSRMVTVLVTGNPGILSVAKSLLEGAEIDYFTKHEGLQGLFPVSEFRVEVQVREQDEAEASKLLKNLARRS